MGFVATMLITISQVTTPCHPGKVRVCDAGKDCIIDNRCFSQPPAQIDEEVVDLGDENAPSKEEEPS